MGEGQGNPLEAAPQGAGAPAVPSAGRLEEIAEVTRRYARFGKLGLGVGILPAALLWVGAAVAAKVGAGVLARALAAAAPPLAIAGAAWARRLYQRHGAVAFLPEPGELTPASGERAMVTWLLIPWLAVEAAISGLVTITRAVEGAPLARLPIAAVLGGVATLWLAWRLRSRPGASAVVAIAVVGHVRTLDVVLGGDAVPGLLLLGLGYGALGVAAHVVYVRLERRLAALREGR